MRMLRAGDHVELLDLLATETVLREQVGVPDPRDPARIAGVSIGDLVLSLVPAQLDLVCIDDDDVVPGVHMGGEDRLVLAAQQRGHLAGEAAQHLAAGVNDVPAALDVLRLGRVGLHRERCRPGKADQLLRLPAETRPRQRSAAPGATGTGLRARTIAPCIPSVSSWVASTSTSVNPAAPRSARY